MLHRPICSMAIESQPGENSDPSFKNTGVEPARIIPECEGFRRCRPMIRSEMSPDRSGRRTRRSSRKKIVLGRRGLGV